MLREGIEAQYDPDEDRFEAGRAGQRRAAYAAAIGDATTWRGRLDGAALGTDKREAVLT
jgi:hypothetical protein